jgi:hypothetical protein
MQLYSNFKQSKYLIWSALQLLLLHRSEGPNKMLQMAEMFIIRSAPKDGTPMASEELQVVIQLLLRQQKKREALDLIRGPLGATYREDVKESNRVQAQILCQLEDWKGANELYRTLLTGADGSPDDWFFLTSFIDTHLKSVPDDGKTTAAARRAPIDTLLTELQAGETKKGAQGGRGPWLAAVHLEVAIAGAVTSVADGAKLATLIGDYFERVGTKQCFIHDVRPYLSHLQRIPTPAYVTALLKRMNDITAALDITVNKHILTVFCLTSDHT